MKTQSYLKSLQKFGIKLGLDNITKLLDQLDNPQLKFKAIHIAGTNGKGSTAAMIASILKAAGYRVGLYTSPHLLKVNERIKVNGKNISDQDLKKGLQNIKGVSGKLTPTYFEALTALAFWYFAKKKVDYAVVEVGMGGRFDATNVISPLVSVITNIDYDHTKYLGKTLAKIAFEKAGIIKPGVPVVTAETKKSALRVMNRVACKNQTVLVVVKAPRLSFKLGLIGDHQKNNAACAIAAIRLARIKVTKKALRQGLASVKWAGRFQVVLGKQTVILDGAHNLAGLKALKVTIKSLKGLWPVAIVFGCQNYKNVEKMAQVLKSFKTKIIVTQSPHPQAMPAVKLAKYFPQVARAKNINQALKLVKGQARVLVCGSIFLVAEAAKLLDAQ